MPLLPLWLTCIAAVSRPPLTVAAQAADWPQWRGPDRSGVSTETGLLKQWPKDGPELAWTFENAGTGYGSFAVVGGRVYVLGARPLDAKGDKRIEQVIALDDKGKERWKADIGPMWDFEGNQWSGGPNSTPSVDGDLVFALGSQGILVCVKAADGAESGARTCRRSSAARSRPAASGRRSSAGVLLVAAGGRRQADLHARRAEGPVRRLRQEHRRRAVAQHRPPRRLHLLLAGRRRDRRRPPVHRPGANRRRRRLGQGRLDAVGIPPRGGVSGHRRPRRRSSRTTWCSSPPGRAAASWIKVTAAGGKFKAEVAYDKKEIASPHGGVVLVGQVSLRQPRPACLGVSGFRDGRH